MERLFENNRPNALLHYFALHNFKLYTFNFKHLLYNTFSRKNNVCITKNFTYFFVK